MTDKRVVIRYYYKIQGLLYIIEYYFKRVGGIIYLCTG